MEARDGDTVTAPVYQLTVSYVGRAYAGWQRQPNAVTVQEVLEDALTGLAGELFATEGAAPDGGRIVATAAGRTDAGVHARGQSVHLELPADVAESALVHGTNHRLPEDVRVVAARRRPAGFHARKSAVGKEYVYRLRRTRVLSPIDAPFAVQVDPAVDVDAMRQAAARLVGRHDFSAFALAGGSHRSPVRTVTSAQWFQGDGSEGGDAATFRVTGDGFLRGMVRAFVGTLVEVGLGRRSAESVEALLTGRPRGEAGPTAPAHGLCLERVDYSE